MRIESRIKNIAIIVCIIIIYLLKIKVLGESKFIFIDIIVLVSFSWYFYLYLKNHFFKNSKEILVRFIIIAPIILLILIQILSSSYYTRLNGVIGNHNDAIYKNQKPLPWSILNSLDSGKNAEVVNRAVIDNSDYCYGVIPREFVNQNVIGDVSYELHTLYGKKINSVTYTSDSKIITSSYSNDSCDDVVLEDMDLNKRDKVFVTSNGEEIMVLSREKEVYDSYRLTVHDNDGKIIESHDYNMNSRTSINVGRYYDGKIYLTSTNDEKGIIEILEIDEEYNMEVISTIFEGANVFDFALVDNEMIIITADYKFIKLNMDGEIIDEQEYKIIHSNYHNEIVNVDITEGGTIYVVKYVYTRESSYDYEGVNYAYPKNAAEYVEMDIYDNDFNLEDTIYYHQDGVGEYSLFFQVQKESQGYKIYSHNDVVTIEPHGKNRVLAVISIMFFTFVFAIVIEFLTNILVKKTNKQ